MQKVYGSPVRQDGLYKIGRNKWELIYGFGKDHEDDETGWNYRKTFDHLPTHQEIKDTIIGQINADTNDKILRGMAWNGKKVWLSPENQRNFILMEMGGEFPLNLKIGETNEGEAIYHVFQTNDALHDFNTAVAEHISRCLNDGYYEKDSIDWSVFS